MCLTNKQDNASIDRKIDRRPGSLLFLADAFWAKACALLGSLEAGPPVQKVGRLAEKAELASLGLARPSPAAAGFAKFQHRPQTTGSIIGDHH
jgi:hypothetical protein